MFTLTYPLLTATVATSGTLGVLLLYVLKLRRRPVRVSTVVFFASAIDDIEANIPWRRLRMSWMLVIHLLIVWLLSLAVGRPVSNAPESKADLVIVLDRSASMGAKRQPNVTALDLAKTMALKLGSDMLDAGGRVAIVAAGAGSRTVLPFSRSRSALSAAIQEIQPVDQAGRLDQAVDTARSMAAALAAPDVDSSSHGSESAIVDHPPRIVLITDGVSLLSTDQQRDVDVWRVSQEPEDIDNLGIVNLSVRRESPVARQCQVMFRVVNASRRARIAPVRVTVNGEVQQRFTIEVDGTVAGNAATSVVGSSSRSISMEIPGEAIVTASIARSDALSSDDSVSVVVPPPRPIRVLFVSATDLNTAAPSAPNRFLSDVLQEIVGSEQSGNTADSGELVRITPKKLANMSESEISQFSVAVFDEIDPPDRFPIGVIAFGSRAGLCTSGTGDLAMAPTRPVWWDRSSPVFIDNPVDAIFIRTSLEVGRISEGVRVLARGVDGPLILYDPQTPSKPGRIAVLFSLSETNWPLQVSFPILVARSLQILSPYGLDGLSQSYRTEEVLTFKTPSPPPKQVTLRRQGDGAEFVFPILDSRAAVALGPFDRAGVYQLSPVLGPPNAQVSAIAVNLANERVSVLQVMKHTERSRDAVRSTATAFGRRDWWRFCVLAAGLLLAAEWVVFSINQRSAGK